MSTSLSRTGTEAPEIDCAERARTALRTATQRLGVGYARIANDVAVVLEHARTLRSAGLTETELVMAFVVPLSGVIADECASDHDIRNIMRERSHCDREDDKLTDLHHIDGPHVVSHKEVATAYRRAAAANIRAADAHEQLAYQERRNAGTTIARLRRTV
jgi:hypothetical protein